MGNHIQSVVHSLFFLNLTLFSAARIWVNTVGLSLKVARDSLARDVMEEWFYHNWLLKYKLKCTSAVPAGAHFTLYFNTKMACRNLTGTGFLGVNRLELHVCRVTVLPQQYYSLFTPRNPRSLLILNGERSFLRVNRLQLSWVVCPGPSKLVEAALVAMVSNKNVKR